MKKRSILKVIATILALSFILFAFAACGSDDDNDSGENNNNNQNEQNNNENNNNGDNSIDNNTDNNTGDGTDNGGEGNTSQEVTYVIEGADGKSGYQIALETGFTGTRDEWLDHFEGTEDAEKAATLRELFNVKHELRVDENGDFKVLVFSDVQSKSPNINAETIQNIKTVIDRENPDLVIFNGDNSYGMNSERLLKRYISNMAGYCEAKKIPWAHVYGNHDDQVVVSAYSGIPKEEQQAVYEGFDYCVSKDIDPDIFGVGNYVLPVFTHDGSKIAFNVWGLDSGGYVEEPIDNVVQGGNYFYGIYEYMQQDQLDWYSDTTELLSAFNGELTHGMMTFHIPLQETYNAWMGRNAGGEWTGEKRENISACAVNCGLYKEIIRHRDIKVIVNSHDHLNDFMAKYNGIKFCYTACVGTEVYHAKDMVGARAVVYSTEKPDDFDTYMSYVIEREVNNDNNTDTAKSDIILDMTVNADNTVTNGAKDGKELVSHDYSSNIKLVKTDSAINKKVVSFTGNENTPSTYNLAASTLGNDLFDGFSYEVMFKVTANDFTSRYVGVLDYEESGGFGLDLYKTSDANTVEIHADFANGTSGWTTITHVINLNEWYHCVFTYDGASIALYVNGEKVNSLTAAGNMRLPTFASRGGEEYICIGACAQAWHSDAKSTGIYGFTGDIAICRIYSDTLSETAAKALYNNK